MMETTQLDLFNRIKYMRICALLCLLLTGSLSCLMLVHCSNKVIIVSDAEEQAKDTSQIRDESAEVVWKIKTTSSKTDGLHIPVDCKDYEYDVDYVHNILIVKINDMKGRFYKENVPYGDFAHIKDATASFDGKTVTYSMSIKSAVEPRVEEAKDELVFSFATISHDKPIVLIDPGHGGNAVGSMAGGLMEKEVNIKIARKIHELAADKDYKVILTRNMDRSVGMGESISIVNITNADYYISLHLDADVEDTKIFGLRAEYNPVYYRDGFENVDFADSLLRSVANATSNKAIELVPCGEEDLVMKVLKIPAASLHLGYISNSSEAELLSKDLYIEKLAQGIIDSLDENIIGKN